MMVREVKACTNCGYQRKIVVHKYINSMDDFWSRFCTACELLASVRRHRQTADRLEARARQILIKRRQKQLERNPP